MDAQRANTPVSLTTLVRDLDPAVERVITRCLDPEPARRPASALSVSAALPGGDPLAAALAAGETPSPELVAAAGEDVALRLRVAIPLTIALLIAVAVHGWVNASDSMLERLRPALSPEVLQFHARNIIRSAGYGDRADFEHGFAWSHSYLGWSEENDKPKPDWTAIAKGRVPVLSYWYREAAVPLSPSQFHDDLLTLGLANAEDPPPIEAGMIHVALDPQGRLLEFHAMPAQKLDEPAKASAPNWSPLFKAAGIDPSTLHQADPLWNFLEASDTRAAWTGAWPGTDRPLRIEAAAFNGKPVVFALLGPWSPAPRMPNAGGPPDFTLLLFAAVTLIVIATSVWLARENLIRGRGDRRGAFHLAVAMFLSLFALWLTRMHSLQGAGVLGYFLIELLVASAFGLIVWTIYLAAEPFVRRYWPHTLIAWTRILSGRIQDGIVGRDILIGISFSCSWQMLLAVHRLSTGNQKPDLPSTDLFLSTRGALREYLENVPHAIEFTLVLFFAIFLLRMILRRDWLAGVVFVLIFAGTSASGGLNGIDLLFNVIIYGMIALVTIRFGLLAMASFRLFDTTLGDLPATFDSSVWFYAYYVAVLLGAAALILWAFRQSVRRSAA